MKKFTLILCFVACGLQLFAQAHHPSQQYKLIGQGSVKAKNFYLLSVLKHDPAVMQLLERDAVLSNIAITRAKAIQASLIDCKDYSCFTTKLKFSDEEIKIIGDRLTALYITGNALDRLVKTQLIPSGTHALYQKLSAPQLLVKAWEIEAAGINNVIAVYAESEKAKLPDYRFHQF